MSLAPGTRLGPYEIVALLGAGGMGEVYKARDTRLDRAVAVKILSTTISGSPEARQRFEREARTISQLSHPHICALFDVGEAPNPQPQASPPPLVLDRSSYGGPVRSAEGAKAGSLQTLQFLVMELLEGETLADRLAKGALPLEQTLCYGIEIADALDKAHRHGVVHRDLKPANVMITKSGVKLLDFGLAKPAPLLLPASMTAVDTAANVPQLSAEGIVAGTLQYMAPEQLEGRPADARSDIFAFGVVLYEMATGRKAFLAGSPVALASAILHHDPQPLASRDDTIPSGLDRLVRTCLAKDPERRWQTAHDVGLQLAAMREERRAPGAPLQKRARAAGVAGWLPWAVAAVAVVLLAASWLRTRSAGPPVGTPVRFLISPPEGGAFFDTVEELCIALSPDGSQLAYLAADASGQSRVWLRPISAVDAHPLAGTDGARAVLWSPDGRSIAFFAGDKLKRLELPDGAPVTLGDVPEVRVVGTWGDGQILFAAIPGGIYRVSTSGGMPTLEIKPDRARGESAVQWPWFLPDGRRVLYLARRTDGTGSVMVGEPGTSGTPPREVLAAVSNVQYVDPGYLVFARDGTLLGQQFDVSGARVVGEAFPIAEPVRYFLSTGIATFATSRNGVLAYQSHTEEGRLVWIDRKGKDVGAVGGSTGHSRVRISPDGRRVLFDRTRARVGTYDLWMWDTEREVEQRLTAERLSETGPVWVEGGKAAIFSGGTPPHLFRMDLASTAVQELLPAPGFHLAEDVSPDGQTLVFTQRTIRGNFDMWMVPISGPRTPVPLMETPFDEAGVRFSPDGRYIAFASTESGRYEVYVSPFPLTAAKTRVSAGGGTLPRWSRDGRELFYVSADLHLIAVPVRTAPALNLGAAQPLFAVTGGAVWSDPKSNTGWSDFDVSPDGKKFMAVIPAPANRKPLTVVMNWLADTTLNRGARGDR